MVVPAGLETMDAVESLIGELDVIEVQCRTSGTRKVGLVKLPLIGERTTAASLDSESYSFARMEICGVGGATMTGAVVTCRREGELRAVPRALLTKTE